MVELTSQAPSLIEPIRPDGRTLARAGLMRGWNEILRRAGVFEAVGRRLTPDVRELLARPPQPTEWVDVAHFECVAQAVLEEVGEARLDDLFLQAARTGWAALIIRWAGTIVWVFGPSPGNVLKHAQLAAKRNTVGFTLEWHPLGDTGGDLVAIYPFRDQMHQPAAWGTSIACQIAADAVGVTVARSRPVIETAPGGGLQVRVHASW
jgi:hypothetical protein